MTTHDRSKRSQCLSLSSLSSSTTENVVVSTPCAACKILRRKCVENCILAPHFPPTEPLKFAMAHRVFGASNIIKLLQELPEYERDDAVSSIVYEANARIIDPVYGSVGTIFHLQKQVNELQAQLAKAKVEILNMKCQHTTMFPIEVCQSSQELSQKFCEYEHGSYKSFEGSNSSLYLDNDLETLWDIIWHKYHLE